ncbi:MAG: TRAP transporter small permease, partial [Betaproteobacteria bacterium]|nr:TRAP transporter small permease [Betaproteobacteria bacterium]
LPWYKRLAEAVSTLSMGVVFVLFIYGVGMRYLLNRPVSWTDEAVTVLMVWSVLWTGAFVLRWSEHISFDIVFVNLAPERQRQMLLVGNLAFVILMFAALPGMVDYTLFLWREKTDMLEMRLDFVYAIFPIFFMAIVVRQLLSLWRLMSSSWQDELARWTGDDQRESP